ncbi:glycosyltransferase family 4 protein [Lentimicrobium sp.]|uniref:glycosyltransferase family 4 protein n=1 Tax=Lentimicrobium sp. TaxID=2034841 RepID=UPI002CA6F215|nr:glycosyltransferase family 4 protein [Lentimicrobium sp.]HPJ62447.1 glycosyltransferase family 4 protein [Lentimicrobium sp.]
MKLIINASNVHVGGMLQVAISFINELVYFPGNEYHIFLSAEAESQISGQGFPENCRFYSFMAFSGEQGGLKKRWLSYRRLSRLRLLERVIKPDVVFTVFGPTFWKPSAPHIAGFAIPFFVYRDSPYFKVISKVELLKRRFVNHIKGRLFTRYVDYLVVETEEVRQRLISIFKIDEKRIFQVHNTYSNIYNHPAQWSDRVKLPERLKGELRLVTISANHRYKNLEIINGVINELRNLEPDLRVKFILTIRKEQFDGLQAVNRKSVYFTDRITVAECPYLYKQCDFMFLPSLLDCFSASYPEAMKMGLPILTSDLSFARNVCGEAAVYFNPLDARDIAEKILLLYHDPVLQARMVAYGKRKLPEFGTARERAARYLQLAADAARSPLSKGLHSEIKEPVLS